MRVALVLVLLIGLVCAQTPPPEECEAAIFGISTAFNVLVLSTSPFYGCNSDVEGAVAVGGDVYLTSYTIGKAVDTTIYPYRYTLIAEGLIDWLGGGIHNGGIIGADTTQVENVEIFEKNGIRYESNTCCPSAICSGCVTGPSGIDFSSVSSQMSALSATFSTYSSSAGVTIVDRYGNIELHCGTSTFNVFSDIAVTSSHHSLKIYCDATQTILINYSADTAGYPPGFGVTLEDGITPCAIINHFTNPSVTISSELKGVLFAPASNLYFPTGLITGDVIVSSFGTDATYCNGGQINNARYCGCVPPTAPNENHCCGYSYDFNNDPSDPTTRTYCSSFACNPTAYPEWTLDTDVVVADCTDCCYSGITPTSSFCCRYFESGGSGGTRTWCGVADACDEAKYPGWTYSSGELSTDCTSCCSDAGGGGTSATQCCSYFKVGAGGTRTWCGEADQCDQTQFVGWDFSDGHEVMTCTDCCYTSRR